MNARRPSVDDLRSPTTIGALSVLWGVSCERVRESIRVWAAEGRVTRAGRINGAPAWRRVGTRDALLSDPLLGAMPIRELARVHGCAIASVSRARAKAGISIARPQVRAAVLAYLREYDHAHTTAEIAEALGFGTDTTSTVVRRLADDGLVERLGGRPALWVIA